MAKVPIWLDCDPGHDDAFALLLSAHHPRLDLLGVSTVHGNISLAHTTENACSLLAAFGRPDIPVYPGAERPLCKDPCNSQNVSGEGGLEGSSLLPKPTNPLCPKPQPRSTSPCLIAMRSKLLATPPGTAWVVVTAALTNTALLFAAFPELAEHIAGLSIMGGAIGDGFTDAVMGKWAETVDGKPDFKEKTGNVTQWAEFNVYADPEALASLLSNPTLVSKTTIVPLDVTHLVIATSSVLSSLLHPTSLSQTTGFATDDNASSEPIIQSTPSPLRRMLHSLLTFFASNYANFFGLTQGPPLHDPCAVAIVLDTLSIEDFGFVDKKPSDDSTLAVPPAHQTAANKGGESSGTKIRWILQPTLTGIRKVPEGSLTTESEAAKAERQRAEYESQLGRTVLVRMADSRVGEAGVRIPRGVRRLERFWTVLLDCVERAEKATEGSGVWEDGEGDI